MYFADLSPYGYLPRPTSEDLPPLLNIGWLDAWHPHPTGSVTDAFVECLWEFCRIKVEATRGLHECDLCPKLEPGRQVTRAGETLWLGSAEIRVFAEGVMYAAPNLIYHYVVDHRYLPPDEFVRAVLDGRPRPGSAEYAALVAEHDPALAPSDRRVIKVNRIDRDWGRDSVAATLVAARRRRSEGARPRRHRFHRLSRRPRAPRRRPLGQSPPAKRGPFARARGRRSRGRAVLRRPA